MHFIKITYLIQDALSVYTCTGTCRKYSSSFCKIRHLFSDTYLISPAEERISVSGIIHKFLVMSIYHQWIYCKYLFRLFYCINKHFHIVRKHFGIIVQQDNIFTVTGCKSYIYSTCKPKVFIQINHFYIQIAFITFKISQIIYGLIL